MSRILDPKKRRLVKDDAGNPEVTNIGADSFTLKFWAGRHRIELTFDDWNIRLFRRAFAAVAKKRKATAESIENMVNGPIE